MPTVTIRNWPIQRKLLLIILATLLVSLVLVMVGIVAYEVATYRKRVSQEVSQLGSFVAANTAPALAFDDAENARQTLGTLKTSPAIAVAVLYTADGRPFAVYSKGGQQMRPPPMPRSRGLMVAGGQLELVRPVEEKGLFLGTLYMRADLAGVYSRLKNYFGVMLVVAVAVGAGSLFLQRLLQRLISDPLLEISGMAQRIAGGDLAVSVPVRSEDEIGHLATAFNGMTNELANSYRRLKESQTRFAGIVSTAMDAIITIDAAGEIMFFNAAAERMFATRADDAIGSRIDRLIPIDLERLGEEGQLTGVSGIRSGGSEFPIEASISALVLGENRFYTVIVRDITERIEAEEALRASEHRLRRAEEIAHFGYWRYEPASSMMNWSDEAYRIHGVSPADYHPSFEGYLKFVHADDRADVEQSMKEAKLDIQYRIIRPNGTLRYLTVTGEVVKGETNGISALFGTYLDTTELRQAERDLQEKNAELERFTYAVSHDLKSPLVTVKTFLGYLEEDLTSSDKTRLDKDLYYIRTAAEKMGLLLDELLEMSRIGRMINPPVKVGFRTLVDESLQVLAGSIIERGVDIRVEGNCDLYGDRPRLAEIWQNLLENAIKFMGDQAKPQIVVGVDRHGGEAVFFVRDNGVGFDPRYANKIFGLFEKLDPKSRGTGLGLALVKRIVELYQGKIWGESQGVGQGACFRFTLPDAVKEAK